MRIIQHWAGPMPEMIQFARWTTFNHNRTVQIANHFPSPFPDRLAQEQSPMQYLADVIRAEELRYGGGLWLDSDYVSFASVRSVVRFEEDFLISIEG